MFACLVALVVSSCLKLGFPFVQHPGVLFLFLFVFPFVMWDIQKALIRLGLNQYLPRAFYFQACKAPIPTQNRSGWGESSLRVLSWYLLRALL